MLDAAALALGSFAILVTALSLIRSRIWWVRIWDFPRAQVLTLGAIALALWVAAGSWTEGWRLAFSAALVASLAYQAGMIWRYTPLAPVEVTRARRSDPDRRLSLVVSNVLQSNRRSDRLLEVLRRHEPDVMLCLETSEWWRSRLDTLLDTHPHVVRCVLENTYGMLVYSRHPLEDRSVDFLIEQDVPSVQATVRLPSGDRVWLNCVHPKPPAPSEDEESTPRDAELIVVGKRVRDAALPVVVCGDLNDVAWSRTTRLFQKISGLLDPRKGRGFFNTFHARYPGLRYPLDHVFHSRDLRLVDLRRLPYVGSDHFPMYIALSYEPDAVPEQEPPHPDAGDEREAEETEEEGKRGRGSSLDSGG